VPARFLVYEVGVVLEGNTPLFPSHGFSLPRRFLPPISIVFGLFLFASHVLVRGVKHSLLKVPFLPLELFRDQVPSLLNFLLPVLFTLSQRCPPLRTTPYLLRFDH